MNFYNKLYYAILLIHLKKEEVKTAPFMAVITMSLMVYLNALIIPIIFSIPINIFVENRIVFIGSLILWGVINACIFLRREKQEYFAKKIIDDSSEFKRKMIRLGIIYLASSFVSVFILILLPLEDVLL